MTLFPVFPSTLINYQRCYNKYKLPSLVSFLGQLPPKNIMVGLGLLNQWDGGKERVVQLFLITIGTDWQSHRKHKSGALV